MRKTIQQTNDNPFEKGIFHTLQGKGSLEWLSSADAQTLDVEYYFQQSGEKRISCLFEKLLDKEEKGEIASALSMLADILIRKYSDKWKRLYDAIVDTNYNPIENYSAKEKETYQTKTKVTTDNDSAVYGFNSESAQPSAENKISVVSEGNADENVRTLERGGNIGVTTSQQMLESEINLRKWNFYASLMIDVDETLCSLVY